MPGGPHALRLEYAPPPVASATESHPAGSHPRCLRSSYSMGWGGYEGGGVPFTKVEGVMQGETAGGESLGRLENRIRALAGGPPPPTQVPQSTRSTQGLDNLRTMLMEEMYNCERRARDIKEALEIMDKHPDITRFMSVIGLLPR